ncbi:MAG: hypothetical protein U0229_12205 [Anaeromyxobacter sp.]
MRAHAKCIRPSPAGLVPRERLFARLDAATAHQRRIWIAGPPGAGKTTLATSWVTARGRPCVWLALDAADRDPATFLNELARAVRAAAPGARLPRFGPEYALGLAAFFRTFFRKAFDALPPDVVLVFDNAQEVPVDAPLFALVREALGEVPPGAATLVVSRELPPPPAEALRVGDTLEVIGPEELRLDADEVRAVAQLRGVEDRAEVAALVEAADGWAAGVSLLLAARGGRAPGAAPGATARTFDYLANEVLDRMDVATRRVLLEASVLPWVDVHAAEAELGIAGAAEVLARLAGRGYFTSRLEGDPPRYRFHPLLRALLERRACAELPAPRLGALRRGGAALLAAVGADGEAVALLRDAGAWEDLAALVERRGPDLLEAGRARDVAAWLDLLPPELLGSSPGLRYLHGMARFGADPAGAAAEVSSSLDDFEAADNGPASYLAWAGLVDALVFGTRYPPLDACLDRLGRLEARFPGPLPADLETRVASAALTAFMMRRPLDPRLDFWLARLEPLAASDPRTRVMAANALLLHDVNFSGRLARAGRVLDEVARSVAEADAAATIILAANRSMHRFVQGDFMGAHDAASDGLARAASSGARLWDFPLTSMQGWSAAGARRVDLVEEALARLDRLEGPSPESADYWRHWVRAQLAALRGDRARAYEEARAGRVCAERAGSELMIVLAFASEATSASLGGAPPGTEPSLEQALVRARRDRSRWAEHLVLLGLAHRERRTGGPALDARLRALFGASREHGYRHPGQLFPEELADLCAAALERGIEPETARAWVTTLHLVPPAWAAGLEGWPWDLSVRVLGKLEVARAGTPVAGAEAGRALDLLGALVALGGADVDAGLLAAELWPDSDGDAARHALETAVYRLRRLLGDPELVVQARGRIGLAPGRAWTDLWALERRLEGLEHGSVEDGAGRRARVAEAYRGELLPGVESPAIRERRARLERRVQRALGETAAAPR